MAAAPILLYDGDCGFCQASVRFVLRHERDQALRFAPLQGEVGSAIRARHPHLAGTDSIVWVTGHGTAKEHVAVRSAAALQVTSYLGGGWKILGAGWIVPGPLRDWVYDLIAKHRHRLGGSDSCALPAPGLAARFLE